MAERAIQSSMANLQQMLYHQPTHRRRGNYAYKYDIDKDLLEKQFELDFYGTSFEEQEYQSRVQAFEQVTILFGMQASMATINNVNNQPQVPEPNGGVTGPKKSDNVDERTSETVETFVDQMDPVEAARYERYWKQDYKDVYKGQPNTRQRQYTAPGTRSITDQKINIKTGELYDRQTIYDEYGRRIGNNDFTDHGRPDVPTHTNPHHHPNPWRNPNQHGPGTPGLHPETPRW